MQQARMIFYVFLTYGAVSGQEVAKNPAAVAQLERLLEAMQALNEDTHVIVTEKCKSVEGLTSLSQLGIALALAQKNGDRVFVDDLRRIFVRCPVDKRRRLIRDFRDFGDVFWETRAGGRSFADLSTDDLKELRTVMGPFRTKRRKAAEKEPAPELMRLQTYKARTASIKSRTNRTDKTAKYIRHIHKVLLAKHPQATLNDLATLLNRRDFKTSRGGTWSAATVKRMLDRAKKLEDET